MTDYTTSLNALLDRAVDTIVDTIAKEGLSALKSTLDNAGFGEYESLKGYEVYAHVVDDVVTFEIVLDIEAIDEETQAKISSSSKLKDPDIRIRQAARSYAMSGLGGATDRVIAGSRDARRPQVGHQGRQNHDARRPAQRGARDARKGSAERLAEHEFYAHAPRGIRITDKGKLSIALERAIEKTERGMRFPQGDFDGILKTFMDRLNEVIAENFVPQLESIIIRSIS